MIVAMCGRVLGTVGLSILLCACASKSPWSQEPEDVVALFGGTKAEACKYVSSRSRPYVVGWDELKLNDLQRQVDRGSALAVRFEGCDLELLTGCAASDSHYEFVPTRMTKPQTVKLQSAAEAFVEFEVGALGLESHFDTFSTLEVTRALGGTWEARGRDDYFSDDFGGTRCEGATHVVQEVDVGAYQIYGHRGRGGGAEARGRVQGIGGGAGGQASWERSTLAVKGDPQACQYRSSEFSRECDTPLRLALQPIRPASERKSACPYGMKRIGDAEASGGPPDFCLDATEVTVAAYRECVEDGICEKPARSRYGTWRDAAKQDHPVTDVNWYDATRYCESVGRRLPTAAEWRWAAQGGAQARAYPWGAKPPSSDLACWKRLGSKLGTCAVGTHPQGASKDGVLNLAGNAREWTATTADSGRRRRVVVGASWAEEIPGSLQVDQRSGERARSHGDSDLGFRCAAAVRSDS